jgi:hypothetical protein
MEAIQASFSHSSWESPMGEARKDALRLDFDRRLKLEFHGPKVAVPRILLREILQYIGQLRANPESAGSV